MQKIYKYPFNRTILPKIQMPVGAQILDVQTQHGEPVMWALVDPEAPKEERSFQVYGTGWDIEKAKEGEQRKYIGTYQMQGGALVFHLFEIVRDSNV